MREINLDKAETESIKSSKKGVANMCLNKCIIKRKNNQKGIVTKCIIRKNNKKK